MKILKIDLYILAFIFILFTGLSYASPINEQENKEYSCTITVSSLSNINNILKSGSVVCLKEGYYNAPILSVKNYTNSVLQAVPGSRVVFEGTTYIYGNYITLANLYTKAIVIGNYDQEPGRNNPNHIELYNIKGLYFEIDSATNVKIEGGSYGPDSACGGPVGGGNNSIRQPEITPENIIIDHTVIHNIQSYNLINCHIEGLAIFAGNHVTVSNSKFYGNSVYDIFMQANSGGNPNNIIIKDNWLARAEDNSDANGVSKGTENGVAMGNEIYSNVLIQGNRFNSYINLNDVGGRNKFINTKVINNVGVMPYNNYPCITELPGIVFENNIWKNDKCGSSDVNLNDAKLPYIKSTNNKELNYSLTGIYAGWPE